MHLLNERATFRDYLGTARVSQGITNEEDLRNAALRMKSTRAAPLKAKLWATKSPKPSSVQVILSPLAQVITISRSR